MGKPRPSDMKRPITGRLRAQGEEQTKQRSTSPFYGTGMSPDGEGGMVVDGNIDVHGDANFDGDTTIGGNAAITGTLSLPAGIIGNDALSDPTEFGFGGNSSIGFAVAVAASNKTAVTIPIPAGFTRALVHCTANASAYNSAASSEFMYVRADITLPSGGGGSGGEACAYVPTNAYGNAAGSAAGSYTNIGTGSITLACRVRSSVAWAFDAANIANVDGTVVFLR